MMKQRETLKFNREIARERYLRDYPSRFSHNPKKLELSLLRGELAAKNPLFVKDFIELDQLSKKGDRPAFEEAKGKFWEKWQISFPSGLSPYDHEPIVKVIDSDIENASFSLTIDLRFPKSKIMRELKAVVDDWKEDYEIKKIYWHHQDELKTDPPNVVQGQIPKDLSDIRRNLNIWSARAELGWEWKKIVDRFKLYDIQTARNHFKAAEKLIENGLPGSPPFPKE
jgi:hypothetical protein